MSSCTAEPPADAFSARPSGVLWIRRVTHLPTSSRELVAFRDALQDVGALACLADTGEWLRREGARFEAAPLDPDWVAANDFPVHVFGAEARPGLDAALDKLSRARTLGYSQNTHLLSADGVIVDMRRRPVVLTPRVGPGPYRYVVCDPVHLRHGGLVHQLRLLERLCTQRRSGISLERMIATLPTLRRAAQASAAGDPVATELRDRLLVVARAKLDGPPARIAAWLAGAFDAVNTRPLDAALVVRMQEAAATLWRLDVGPLEGSELALPQELDRLIGPVGVDEATRVALEAGEYHAGDGLDAALAASPKIVVFGGVSMAVALHERPLAIAGVRIDDRRPRSPVLSRACATDAYALVVRSQRGGRDWLVTIRRNGDAWTAKLSRSDLPVIAEATADEPERAARTFCRRLGLAPDAIALRIAR